MQATDLPTGTVTFLFTDIEGSTRLWEDVPEAMRAAMLRHDRIVEEIVGANGGVVVRPRGEGDSRFAVFPRATEGIVAAVGLQRALLAEPWPTPTPLRVRMALHTGEADLREGDYYGSAVNRCARLRSVASGGQTLASAATYALALDGLPEDITIRDLGQHQLKDLQLAEHIYQVDAPGTPTDFPPLKTLDVLPNNLPAQLTTFLGRDHEIEEVKRLFSTARLLTLTGAGGTGKTRLALHVAADLLDSYPDGVWLVELAPLTNPTLIPQAIASAVGVREVAGIPVTETLINYSRSKTMLLILDNCEHLIEECARLVGTLLRACPGLAVLVTSRESLDIPGEVSYRVPSLSLPDPRRLPDLGELARFDAVGLFLERARLAQPGFALTQQNARAVADICVRLDGIPLAIELAAARVRVLSVEQIAARLDDRFRLLTGGSRTALPRQQTLQAAMDWSYDLLPANEQTLLRRLSVFKGGWSLGAAEVICSGDGIEDFEVLDLLEHLVDKSLVAVDQQAEGSEEARYHFLETIRQYASVKLADAGEVESVRDRHLDYFVTLAEQLDTKTFSQEAKDAFDRLDTEHDNLRAACEWSLGKGVAATTNERAERGLRLAAALGTFWWWRGYLNEGRHWVEAALTRVAGAGENLPSMVLIALGKALASGGTLAMSQGDTEQARARLEQSSEIQRRLGDREGLANSLHMLGHVTFDRFEYVGARALFEESLSLFRELNSATNITWLIGDLGLVAYHLGDYPEAHLHFEEALEGFQSMHLVEGGGELLIRLGDLARSEGDPDRAEELYRESLDQFRSFGYPLGTASALHKLGQVARARGEFGEAASLIVESLQMQREAGNKQGIAECLVALAGLASDEGRLDRAARLFGAADALLGRIKVPLTPADRAVYDHDLAVCAPMGESAWRKAWQEGRAMNMDEAVNYALSGASPQS